MGTIHTLYTTDSSVNVMLRKLWTPSCFSEPQYLLFRLFTFSLHVKSICCWFMKPPAMPASSPHWGKSFCVTLVLFGFSFKIFIALWAEEFDTTLWTAKWHKRFSGTCFYSSAKFLYFHFVSHWTSCLKCFTILHVIVYGVILFTELSVTFFRDPL